ncbi:phosphate ABC transporter ATP-binding protein PstB [Spiroplasma endosymbiont of Amphibalanus improvisus]|uniref:phosphate ABC transporter ATP-binding protein PstB n=1 Tax=Spiroplasma endosymbiont of Amphibalanus improvisus TaxID=3066327 RepID=UPI00313E0DED
MKYLDRDLNYDYSEKRDSLIKIKNVSFSYSEEKKILNNISFNIKEKTTTAFIGPSGCGKSTLLRLFNRMNDFEHKAKLDGEIKIKGKNIYGSDVDVMKLRTNVGMVFQTPQPFLMSIYDNVAFGPRNHGVKDKKILNKIVEDSLKKAALWDEVKDKLKSSALSLSGGQQQRLCIARTIAMKPKILLMDEPTSALDPIATGKIEQLITELKKDFTIIIVTHHMQQAARISDYTAFFLNGELIEYNMTKILFSRPEHIKTLEYITGKI